LDRVGLSQSEVSVESAVNRPIQSVLNLVHGNEDRQPLPSQINGAISRIEKYAVIAPGATKAYNIWPTEQLAITMQALHDQFSLYLYLIGSTADAPVCEELVRRMPEYATSMGGKTNLQEVARLISRAEIFVGMDSGMAHVAGALGKPTVVLFPFPSSCKEEHSNSAVRFRPAGPHVRVLQPEHPLPPCNPTCIFPGSHCITQIDPEQVITAARELLDEVSAGNEPPIKRSK
jgi:ADP-heptose:LPS heptosyltransferase